MFGPGTNHYPSMADAELIHRYVTDRDQLAAQALVERHHGFVFGRLRSVLPVQEAEEGEQNIWRRLFCSTLEKYDDDGRFKHYLSICVKNEIKQYWKKTKSSDLVVSLHEFDQHDSLWIKLKDTSPEELQAHTDLLRQLVTEIIPSLAPLKRMVWLLRNEAEFLDANLTMNWETLAQLNGLSVEDTWEKFESARTQLLSGYGDQSAPQLDTEALLIFLVWTHAQRPVRHGRYTLKEIANWTGVSESTLKDRYYDAEKRVATALALKNQESSL